MIFAYTIKGYGLEIAGRPQNHSALLTPAQIDTLRAETGLTPDTEWDTYGADRAKGAPRSSPPRLDRRPGRRHPDRGADRRFHGRIRAKTSTQTAFGRALLDLSRVEGVGERLVTVSPDVSIVDQPRRLHQQGRRLGPGRGERSSTRWRTRR